MGKKVLLYYPPNSRSIAIETICKTVIGAGHELFVLTMTERGSLHQVLEEMGAKTYSYVVAQKPSGNFYWKHFIFLTRFCRKNSIDTVWSHLASANLIAVFSRYFIRARIFAFRHHDESAFYALYGKQFGMKRQKKEILGDRIINRFAKRIVVLSQHVKDTMIKYERCDEKKIIVCPLIYDFNRYPLPDPAAVCRIRNEMNCNLLLIMVSRMVESKQHLLAFEVVHKLIERGLSIRMVVLDEGPLKSKLEKFIEENNLHDYIRLVGRRTDFINYMAASDLLVHPSLTEASNNVVKEMALLNKPVAVCSGVGDFDDYIIKGFNGYILYRENLSSSLESAILSAYENAAEREEFGKNLHASVTKRFSDSDENSKRYLQLI